MSFIGDSRCKYNALSLKLRCAINPSGPCKGCPDYAKASLRDRLQRWRYLFNLRNISITQIFIGIFYGKSDLDFIHIAAIKGQFFFVGIAVFQLMLLAAIIYKWGEQDIDTKFRLVFSIVILDFLYRFAFFV
jgi:Family of unknown function (DUF6464)